MEMSAMGHPCQRHNQYHFTQLTRREFLGTLGIAAASLAVTACQSALPGTSATSAPTSSASTPAPTQPLVAIVPANSYDSATIRKQVRAVLDAVGGLKGVVHSGDRVAIKINLTGGTSNRPLPGTTAIETYLTHPEVVRALGDFVREAGAKELYIVEAVYEDASWTEYGFADVAKSLSAKLVDLNNTAPYTDFAHVPVGNGAYIYKDFTFNHILQDIDTFISVPKMKMHNTAGVTLSMKNLFGTAPLRFYRASEGDNFRSGFHGTGNDAGVRVPRIIVDLNRARPVNFALIDGIKTTEGGEGPWINGMAPVNAGVLIAGANPLATDTVATAVMGYDATAASMKEPFVHSDNHLALAAQMGLGTNRLADIKVVGAAVSDVMKKFKPSY
jgi:uncharacterized protein (DUF362 family)